jgi:two-component system sensor histidine kinase RpfC
VIERLLTQCGHRVDVVADGNAALAALARAAFDAAVVDLNMPGRSGFDVARDVAERPQRPRLVALTADATAETRDACLAAGFDAYLTKPADGPRLLAALHPTDGSNADARAAAVSDGPAGDAPAEGAADEGVLDPARIRMLRQLGDDAFVAEVVESFIEDGARLVDELADAAVAGDAARFRDAAHALRSAATHLGATALFERCLAVKSIDTDELGREAPAIRADLARAFEATAAALRAAARPVTPPNASTGCAPAAASSGDPAARAPAPARPTGR